MHHIRRRLYYCNLVPCSGNPAGPSLVAVPVDKREEIQRMDPQQVDIGYASRPDIFHIISLGCAHVYKTVERRKLNPDGANKGVAILWATKHDVYLEVNGLLRGACSLHLASSS